MILSAGGARDCSPPIQAPKTLVKWHKIAAVHFSHTVCAVNFPDHDDSAPPRLPASLLSLPYPNTHPTTHHTHISKWMPQKPPSSLSRSPESSAEPVRNAPPPSILRSREINGEMQSPIAQNTTTCEFCNGVADGLTDWIFRFSRRCHSGARRVHGRHNPIHHPKRQGTR